MSSASENKLSNEELKRRNLPTEPPSLAACPTAEQWEELLGVLNSQYRLLTAQSNALNALLTMIQTVSAQESKQTKELLNICQQLEQAGSKKERRRLRLPRIRLPKLPTVTRKGAAFTLMLLVVSGILLYASVTAWNNLLKPLLALLP